MPADTLGLALSGGGVRSAAFCLGVLQALARGGWLPRVDFLSTVSGGGFIGSFLGRFFDQCAKPAGFVGATLNETPGIAQERVVRSLADGRSAPLDWLARHANYLSPSGLGEAVTNFAGFWRNLLAIDLVLGTFIFAVYGAMNALAYSSPQEGMLSLVGDFIGVLTPLTANIPAPWAGPWLTLAEASIWLTVAPLILSYWLVSQEVPEAFLAPVLIGATVVAGALVFATSSPLALLVLAASVFWVLEAWAFVRRTEGQFNPLNPTRLLLPRNHLTRRLAFWMGAALIAATLGLVDGLGRWLATRMLDSGLTVKNFTMWFTSVGMSLLALAGTLRIVTHRLMSTQKSAAEIWTTSRPYFYSFLILVCGALPPLVGLAFASHVAYELGTAYTQGLWITGLAAVVSLFLGGRTCVPFINLSSPLSIYAARLARAFLGAVNPQRRLHPDGANVTHVIPGDDVPFEQYQPQAAGGPLHLINCAVNETVDVASQRGLRDRQAENLAIGPAGMNIARNWHALWSADPALPPALIPLAPDAGGQHPFLSASGGPVAVESLGLREWVAISGAAFGPGMGRQTSLARSLLLTLANVRLGYWWNSGLTTKERAAVPVREGLWLSILNWVFRWFQAQGLLLSELTARFKGPWGRYWYLSDGGNFEVTGAYELLRRRVPFVIACDAGRDLDHDGSDLATLVRLARIDLGAEIVEAGVGSALSKNIGLPAEVAPFLGTLNDLLAPAGGPSRVHAALFSVRYPAAPAESRGDAWVGRGHTGLLYLKATLTGDEPADVLNYAALSPDFPNESTLNQVFDEPQWESYRKLGDHIGANLFV